MAIVVQKYGGSSVADLDRLRAVANRVMALYRSGNDAVVVVSAMGKTTENLLELAREAARSEGQASGEPPRRELDMLLSTGERVSMALLSIAIQARGQDAVSLTGSQSGIITNDRHFDARIIEVRPHRIEDELARGRIVIVAGYQGMSYRREITTLGRGGSDTTAVAVAAARGAARCEIYSDVDGVYTADPRTVSDARHLPYVDFDTMQEMAECGAKVLNAQAVEWARRHGVKLHARRTMDAPGSGRETLVGPMSWGHSSCAVVVEHDVALARTTSSELGSLLAAARAAGISLRDTSAGPNGAVSCLGLLNVPDFGRISGELRQSLKTLELERGLSSLSVIGPDIGERAGAALDALAELDITPRWFFTTPLRVSACVNTASLRAAERAWHRLFVGETLVERLSA